MEKMFTTDRLILRILEPPYGACVLDYYKRNKSFLRDYEPERPDSFYTLSHHKKTLKLEMELTKSLSLLRLWLFKKEDPQRAIGTLAFSNIVRGCFKSCFLGYKLDQDELRHGYMTEALKKGIQLAFNDYGLHRIEANIMPRNKPSIGLVEGLGFVNEGISRKYLQINGIWEDHYHYVLLNEAME